MRRRQRGCERASSGQAMETAGGDMRYDSNEAHEAERQRAPGNEACEADVSGDAEESRFRGTMTRGEAGRGSQ